MNENIDKKDITQNTDQSTKKKNKKPLAIIIIASAVVLALGLSCLFIIPAIQKEMFHKSLLGSWVVTGTDGDMIIFLEDELIDEEGLRYAYKTLSKTSIAIYDTDSEQYPQVIEIELDGNVMKTRTQIAPGEWFESVLYKKNTR